MRPHKWILIHVQWMRSPRKPNNEKGAALAPMPASRPTAAAHVPVQPHGCFLIETSFRDVGARANSLNHPRGDLLGGMTCCPVVVLIGA